VAIENCRQCHDVGSTGHRSSFPKPSPAFREVANMAATTPLSLRIFLTTNHPTMPDVILSRKELDDVISHILSLRKPAPTRS
jgi:cytochrome c